MPALVYAVDHPDLSPYPMSDRIRHEVAYFMSVPGENGVPRLGPGEYWVSRDEARGWLDEGAILLISPLDSASRTEVELSEEQEGWLEWMTQYQIQHIRIV
jgi:hypothetical protein